MNKILKILSVLLLLIIFTSSCTTLPKFSEVPADHDKKQMAQIKLVTANPEGFQEQYGGSIFSLTCLLIPNFRKAGSIVFDDNFMVYVKDSWETSNDSFFNERFKFNDTAVFSIPAGKYEVCAHKLTPRGSMRAVKYCTMGKKINFEAGKKYEIHILYRETSKSVPRGTLYRTYLEITKITGVKKFTKSPGF